MMATSAASSRPRNAGRSIGPVALTRKGLAPVDRSRQAPPVVCKKLRRFTARISLREGQTAWPKRMSQFALGSLDWNKLSPSIWQVRQYPVRERGPEGRAHANPLEPPDGPRVASVECVVAARALDLSPAASRGSNREN